MNPAREVKMPVAPARDLRKVMGFLYTSFVFSFVLALEELKGGVSAISLFFFPVWFDVLMLLP